MKINQIIREKRKELSLTQEQVAEYLGVSAPAVNKWEKGSTYPDITLLPALARLLKTDLNTLMSFNDDLTDLEVVNFVNEVDRVVREQDYEAAFQMAIDKIHEYPTCETLIYSVILYLDGALFLYGVSEPGHYKEIFKPFYERMSTSENVKIRETAISMLISYHLDRGDFSKAEELINTLQSSSIDQEERLALLYTKQEKYLDAEKIWEHRVLNSVTEIQTALMNMMEIAIQEARSEDAEFYADVYEQVSKLFYVSEWIPFIAKFQLSVLNQDKNSCFLILRKMLFAMTEEWKPQNCPLYRHMDGGKTSILSNQLSAMIQNEMEHSEEFSFIRDSQEYKQLLKELAEQSDKQQSQPSRSTAR